MAPQADKGISGGGGLPQISASTQQLTALVNRAQSGSSEAFAQIYELYFDRAYYTARKVVRDAQVAEEIVQEAFLRILTKIDTLREPEKFNSWFFSIVYYESTHYLRDNRKVSQAESLDALEDYDPTIPEAFDPEFLPQEALATKEDRALLLSLIDKLTVAQRLAVVLYYYDELTIPQIAEALGVSSPAVSKRLFDARTVLKAGFTQASRTATAPVNVDQKPLVLSKLMSEDVSAEESGAAKERTTAWIAGCLPTLLASQMSNPALASRAQVFLNAGKGTATAKTSTRAPHLAAKIAALVVALALVATACGYAIYKYVGGDALGAPPVATNQEAAAPAASVTTTSTPTVSATQSITTTTPAATPTPTPTPAPAPAPKSAAPVSQSAATPAPAPTPTRPVIAIVRPTLSYPAGTPVSATRILADACASAYDSQGAQVPVTLSGLAAVDFSMPGSYQVYLHATDHAGLNAKTKVLTIVIE
ncbi:MAG: sigma-70 family RNA polymerase sigma factor [Coriobacteriia bacterium]|nr:sigma-70 family RNA polymerase sigma factor [Coriobacteriia bacterium]